MALRRPLDGDCFATVPSTSLATLSSLNRSINATIRSLCTLFYASVAAAPAGPPSPPSDFWTQHPDAATFGMQRLYLVRRTQHDRNPISRIASTMLFKMLRARIIMSSSARILISSDCNARAGGHLAGSSVCAALVSPKCV
eukprot:6196258-Pleurochrysis_carterae.AAC.1